MKNKIKFLKFSFGFFMIFMLSMAFSVQSQTTWYIDPGGNDISGNGTSDNPWKSLYKACNAVKTSGDTIHVNAGTYNETSKASLTVGVSIEGEGVTSIIKPSHSSSGAISLSSSGSSGINGNQSISYIKLDGSVSGTCAIKCFDRGNINIHHCTIVNFLEGAVHFEGHADSDDGNVVHDCIINDCGCWCTVGGNGINVNDQNDCLIYNNTFDFTGRATGQNGDIIGGLAGVKGLKIYNNTFTKPDDEGANWNFFIEIWYLSDECEIYNNTFNGNATIDIAGSEKGSGAYGVSIHDNIYLVSAPCATTEHGTQAIDLESHSGSQMHLQYIYVYNNYFKYPSTGVEVYVNAGSSGTCYADHIYIYNNVFDKPGTTDNYCSSMINVNINGTDLVFDQIEIYNNTMLAGTNAVRGIWWDFRGAATNVKIRNNIIQGSSGNPITFYEWLRGSSITNLSIENNLYYHNSPNSVDFTTVDISNKTEQNNLVGNPVFVSSTDFHLQSGSPAIGSGISVGIETDKDGVAWKNPPSIGAFEWLSTGNTQLIADNKSFSVFPNPVKDKLTIVSNEKDKQVSLKLYDSKGTKLNEKIFTGSTVLDMGSYSSGLYFLNVKVAGRELKAMKIIKETF